MKMDKVAGSQNDEFYTPSYAVAPIVKYVLSYSTVWCPFDTEESNFVKVLRTMRACKVIATHLKTGMDFLTCNPPECEYIISNPPYSLKTEVLERCFSLRIPFAMLLGVVGLFESQRRFKMFQAQEFEILYLNKRVAYFKDFFDEKPSINPPFSSVYITQNMLPSRIVFAEIEK